MSKQELPYPAELYNNGCSCVECFPGFPDGRGGFHRVMNLCPQCGNKRCPGAMDHKNPCTKSNDPKVNDLAWEVLRLERGMSLCACDHALHKRDVLTDGPTSGERLGCGQWVATATDLCDSCKAGTCEMWYQVINKVKQEKTNPLVAEPRKEP